MNQSKKFIRLLFISLFSFLSIISCTTEDILPAISLEVSNPTLSEDNGVITIEAVLNSVTSTSITVPITVTGTATLLEDYTVSTQEIVIASGSTSGSMIITGIQDDNIEGIETLRFTLGVGDNYLILSEAVEVTLLDDDSDTDGDGVLDAVDECPNTVGEPSNFGCPFLGFLINEVLYDPQSGTLGDANGDGTRDANEDEFIEFFNSGEAIDLTGYTISDSSQIRHTFPSGSIIPVNGVLVLFGGGTPTGTFGGAIVQTASGGLLNMSNSGDLMTLMDVSGNVVLTFDIEPLSNNPNESYTRNPDLTGEFVQHAGIESANSRLFSPGTKIDGTSF